MVELYEPTYEWAHSRTAGFVLFHTLGRLGTRLVTICAGYSCSQGLIWLLGVSRTQRYGYLLSSRDGEEALHRDYSPKGSLARRSLPLSELISIRDVLCRPKDYTCNIPAKARVGGRIRALLLQYKTDEEAPQETELGQNVT